MVTGTGSGVGAHLARVAGRAGARVVLTAPRVENLEKVAQDIEFENGQVTCVAMDVADQSSVERAFDCAEVAYGVIDVILNNACVEVGPRTPRSAEDDLQARIFANYDGVWRVATSAARRLIKARCPGSIINVTSLFGLHLEHPFSHYATETSGFVQLGKSLALDFATHQVRVNTIVSSCLHGELVGERTLWDPSPETVPMRREGNFSELDGAFLLLASNAGSYMTGALLAVDGGCLANLL